jgi:hypothetical protein
MANLKKKALDILQQYPIKGGIVATPQSVTGGWGSEGGATGGWGEEKTVPGGITFPSTGPVPITPSRPVPNMSLNRPVSNAPEVLAGMRQPQVTPAISVAPITQTAMPERMQAIPIGGPSPEEIAGQAYKARPEFGTDYSANISKLIEDINSDLFFGRKKSANIRAGVLSSLLGAQQGVQAQKVPAYEQYMTALGKARGFGEAGAALGYKPAELGIQQGELGLRQQALPTELQAKRVGMEESMANVHRIMKESGLLPKSLEDERAFKERLAAASHPITDKTAATRQTAIASVYNTLAPYYKGDVKGLNAAVQNFIGLLGPGGEQTALPTGGTTTPTTTAPSVAQSFVGTVNGKNYYRDAQGNISVEE